MCAQRTSIASELDQPGIGGDIFAFAAEIYPICRSISGEGVRDTLRRVGRHINVRVSEVASGTKVFDWTVPPEWNIRDAYIKDERGRRIVDFEKSNLHVVSYSSPVRLKLPLRELRQRIFTLPDQPDLIPYRTSYYAEGWGFCMAHRELMALNDGVYEVAIDASLEPGAIRYGEYLHRGESEDEFLFSTHICHPSLANDNCSGIAVMTHLAKNLSRLRTRYSYRFLFVPGTIGAIAWLALNEKQVSRIKAGLVVSGVGDGGGPTYKKSRRGNAMIDRVMSEVVGRAGGTATILDFSPYGYDERQYCSPGFNLPVGLFQGSQFGRFPEYHTSADNLDFIKPEHLGSSYRMIVEAVAAIEGDWRPLGTVLKCEPQLGSRGLYGSVGGDKNDAASNMALLWVLSLADGEHSLPDIAERAGMPIAVIDAAASRLRETGLLRESDQQTSGRRDSRQEQMALL